MTRRIRRGAIFAHAIHRCFREFARNRKAAAREPNLSERASWLTDACRRTLKSLGVEVHHQGQIPATGLIVSNHLSYLDILCISSLAPCVFVSKAEVKGWPVFGRLAINGGTVFINRESKADARRVNLQLEELLREGLRVVVFPEGTSSGGDDVLKFHAPLFEAAIRSGVQITPACIRYQIAGGDPRKDVCYWGDMTFASHFLGLLGKGRVKADIRFGEPRQGLGDRKQAALLLHEDVAALHAELYGKRLKGTVIPEVISSSAKR